MKSTAALAVVLLLTGSSYANAAADFLGIQRGSADLNDATPSRVVNFTLPASVNRSSSVSNSAVLDLEVFGSEFNYNEVYINPPTLVCTSNATDANQNTAPAGSGGSVGTLIEHDDTHSKVEWSANHIAFSSAYLKSGANTLLICIRSTLGEAGPGVGNLDDISVRSIVLHYHTSP